MTITNPFTTPTHVVITCNNRLSPWLESEVRELGYEIENSFSTGVELEGTIQDCIRLNLNLRCASQVLYSLRRFRADSPEDVYRTLVEFPWEKLIALEGYFSVTSTVDHFTVNNNLFVNVKIKDAIADRMRKITGKRPDSGSELDHTVVHLFWKEEHAEIFLDTSGHSLAKHGYRKIPGKAPMLEALAAATVMATKWDRQCPFVNPMCGSATVAIEAALLATNRSPGLYRSNYSFMHIIGYESEMYDSELKTLKNQVKENSSMLIIASDLSEDAIEISKVNAAAAGVENLIRFSLCEFEKTEIPPPPGVIYFNPGYGERMGEIAELEKTYARMGDFMKNNCSGYLGYVFTGNLDLAKKIGLKASRRTEFYTARLDCRLLEYEMYAGTKRKFPSVKNQEPES